MKSKKEVEITIKEDGTIDIEQLGYFGKECAGDVDDLIKTLGRETHKKKKPEFHSKTQTVNRQRIGG